MPDANGAIQIDGIDGVQDGNGRYLFVGDNGQTLGALDIQTDAAKTLLEAGYTSYALKVERIAFTGDAVELEWKAVAAKDDGDVDDITELFARAAYTGTVYALYGSTEVNGTYTLIKSIPLSTTAGAATVSASTFTAADGTTPTFFKVKLFAASDTVPASYED